MPPRRLDEKLSRGLVRQEVREIDRDLNELVRRLRGVMNPAMTKIGRGQKITDRDLGSIDSAFRDVLADRAKYLEGAAVRDLRSLQSRNHFAQARVLNIVPNDARTEFSLGAARFLVEPRRVVIAALTMPLSFSGHLAERLLQRRRSEISAKPVTSVGQSMAESTGLLAFAIRIASKYPERRLAIPYEEGLILGEVREAEPHSMFDIVEFTHEGGERNVPFLVPTAFTPVGQKIVFSEGRILEFSGRTFIGRDEMYPDQEDLHAVWTDFARRHAPAVGLMARFCLWPGLTDRELDLMWDDEATKGVGMSHLEAACEEAEQILCNPGIARAMGNSAPPANPPDSFLVEGRRKRKLEEDILDGGDGPWIDTGYRR